MKKAACIPLFICVMFVLVNSCKKDLSCDQCLEVNKPPVASAGPDQAISLPKDSVLLDGRLSKDPDGSIRAWAWRRISGPVSSFIVKPADSVTTVRNLVSGIYSFELTVTDNQGEQAIDTVGITVSDPQVVNRPPIAHAGNDTTILLPANTFRLNGSLSSDPDNNITGYLWTKVSGPSSYLMDRSDSVHAQVTNATEGVYFFELLVTDAAGLSDRDTVKIIVERVIQAPPCTDCGIVFVSDRDGNLEIYSCKSDGTDNRRLTNGPDDDTEPAWSPGGSRIAFVSDRSGVMLLYVMNADGSDVIQKTFTSSAVMSPSWSPDGRKIAYTTLSNGSMNIWIIDANVTGAVPVLLRDITGFEAFPSWSPDGQKIAFTGDQHAYDFVYDIWTINADGTNLVFLTNDLFDRLDFSSSRWSPDGGKLAVLIDDASGLARVGIMNPDGSALSTIVSGANPWTKLSWSPDGSRILYTVPNGTGKSIAWVSADGANKGILVSNGWDADWMH